MSDWLRIERDLYDPDTGVWVGRIDYAGREQFGDAPGGGGTAEDTTYQSSDPSLTNVQQALDRLFYVAPVISGMANNVGIVEIGTTVTSVVLSWSLNKVMTALSLNNGIGSISAAALTFTHSAQSITTNRTYTLTAGDGVNTTNASTTVQFLSKRYWGTSASTTPTDAEIRAWAQEFATSRVKSTFNVAGGGNYIFYAYPDSFGAAAFTVGGLSYSDVVLTTRTVVNASGVGISYRIYRTGSVQFGTLPIAVS